MTDADDTPEAVGNTAPGQRNVSALTKHIFIVTATKDRTLSNSERAILNMLVDYANSQTGLAWPSLATLARDTGFSRRQIIRATRALTEKGWVHLAEAGTRTRSNRYLPAFERKEVVTSASLGVVTSMSKGSDTDVTKVVTSVSPDPSDSSGGTKVNTGMKKEGNVSERAPPRGGASAPPGTLSGQQEEEERRAAFSDKYPKFWAAYPLQANVAAAERVLDELTAKGASMADIIAGASRYREYCQQNPRMRMDAVKWLDRQGWRDSWLGPTKASKESTGQGKAKIATTKKATTGSIPQKATGKATGAAGKAAGTLGQVKVENAAQKATAMIKPSFPGRLSRDEKKEHALALMKEHPDGVLTTGRLTRGFIQYFREIDQPIGETLARQFLEELIESGDIIRAKGFHWTKYALASMQGTPKWAKVEAEATEAPTSS